MTAEELLENFVIGQTYKIEVKPSYGGVLYWDISLLGPDRISDGHYARMLADGYEHPQETSAFWPVAVLSTPPMTDEKATDFARKWLTDVRGVIPAEVDCLLMLPGGNTRLGPR
jgi:hypothetical protein